MRHGRWSGSAATNKGYETAGFGTKTAVGADAGGNNGKAGEILRQIDFNCTRNDSGAAKIDLA